MNENAKTTAWVVVGGVVLLTLWEGFLHEFLLGDGTPGSGLFGTGGPGRGTDRDGSGGNGPLPGLTGGGTGGAGGSGSGSGSGTGGAGGAGGSGGTGGGVGDYTALAAAINALAAGVALPNVRTVSKAVSAGTTELVAGEGGKRVCVVAYCATGSGTVNVRFRSTLSAGDLWAIALAAVAGNSGANLSTAWPCYLFASQPAEGIAVNVDSAATVAITYWQENA